MCACVCEKEKDNLICIPNKFYSLMLVKISRKVGKEESRLTFRSLKYSKTDDKFALSVQGSKYSWKIAIGRVGH